jgi:hypothetical protein
MSRIVVVILIYHRHSFLKLPFFITLTYYGEKANSELYISVGIFYTFFSLPSGLCVHEKIYGIT